MGKFVVALVVFELFCVCHLSYTLPFTDDYDSLYDYSSIDPYRFIGLGHSGRYHSSGNSNLGTYRFSGGGSGYGNLGQYQLGGGGSGFSNLGQYQLGGGGSGYSNLGTYRFSGGYSNLGHDHLGSYSSLYDDDGYGDLYRRYSSLGSYQPRGSRYLRSYNIGSNSNLGLNHDGYSNLGLNHNGYSNLGPYGIGGYSIGNNLVSYLPNRNQRADKYYPDGYSARTRNIYK